MIINFPDKKKRRIYKENFLYILMMVFGFIMLVPLIWVVLTAFKTEPEIARLPITWLPESFLNFDNFVQMFSEQPFGRYFFKFSFIIFFICKWINFFDYRYLFFKIVRSRFNGSYSIRRNQ